MNQNLLYLQRMLQNRIGHPVSWTDRYKHAHHLGTLSSVELVTEDTLLILIEDVLRRSILGWLSRQDEVLGFTITRGFYPDDLQSNHWLMILSNEGQHLYIRPRYPC